MEEQPKRQTVARTIRYRRAVCACYPERPDMAHADPWKDCLVIRIVVVETPE